MPIHILPPEIASQIAAGEVVERPASVVKELLENALDARASRIAIAVAQAGRQLIEVSDNGHGIPAEEVPLAVARHATSKLERADDLFRIGTLGFRGEALASIASVSRLTLISRDAQSETATRIRVEGGHVRPPERVAAPPGTTVRVEDLFYNVPARLKFLKTEVTERRAINVLVARYALAYPRVRFKLMHEGRPGLQTSGDGDQRAILASLYGADVARQMLEVQAEEEGLRLRGFISPTGLTRSNRREMSFFVNGRWVQDLPLNRAVLQAYHTLLMVGRFPLTMLFLDIAPENVDVNVHPTKAEVRFREHDRVFSFVQRAVRRAILAYAPVPSTGVTQNLWSAPASRADAAGWQPASGGLSDWDVAHTFPADAAAAAAPAEAPSAQSAFSGIPILRLVGQIGATYLVAEGPDGLYLIDQHAAHERVLFEKLMAQVASRDIPAQALLSPVSVTLPPHQSELLAEKLPILAHLGFDVQPFGPHTFQVRAMPVLFGGKDPAAALRALVEDFEGDETPLADEVEARIAARVCKRMAVKGGQTLTPAEQESLLRQLEACESPRTCPHGRPTMIHISVDTLEKQFGRQGAR